MAESDEKDRETKEIRFTPSPKALRYLDWLAKHTVLGKSGNEVAEQLLMQKLSEMRQDDYKQPDK